MAGASTLTPETIEFANRMFDAAREGNDALLTQAIDAGLPVNMINDKGNTLLMLSAYSGHATLVQALLSRGADPNRLNDQNQSIIAGATFKGHDDIIKSLLAAGADPRTGTPNAIQTAHIFGRKDLLEVLGARDEDIGENVPTPPSMMPKA